MRLWSHAYATSAVVGLAGQVAAQAAFPPGPPGVDIWCGKAYRATNSSFDPGGWLDPPSKSKVLLLNLQVYPRMNVYLEDETSASLVVDAELGYEVGVPFCDGAGAATDTKEDFIDAGARSADIKVEIKNTDASSPITLSIDVSANTTGNEIPLSIEGLTPSFSPYELHITALTPQCGTPFTVKSQIYRLPARRDGGSVTKLDYLHGGLHVRAGNSTSWKPVFPYSFYVDWGNYLKDPANQTHFASLGYNTVHPTPGGGDTPFEPDLFMQYMDRLESMDQYMMYDMRWTYKNDSLVTAQVEKLKARKSILLWYTADEPDGQTDALDAPLKAYDLIKDLDPYHPTSLVLNCGNFHYADYTRGADIVLTDPYPVAMNASWSNQWNTVCNTTYGDCGCDNCIGSFRDVTTRMDNLQKYRRWLSNVPSSGTIPNQRRGAAAGRKSFWGVPQAFGGSEYWQRPPTAKEEMVMVWLFINHGAKGIMAWNFPTTPELEAATSTMAKLVTSDEVTGLLLGDNPRPLTVTAEARDIDVDAAAWIVGDKMLLSIVYLGLVDTKSSVSVALPSGVQVGRARQIWPMADTPGLRPQTGDGDGGGWYEGGFNPGFEGSPDFGRGGGGGGRGREEGGRAQGWDSEGLIGQTEIRVEDHENPWPNNRFPPTWRVHEGSVSRAGLPAMSVSVMVFDIIRKRN